MDTLYTGTPRKHEPPTLTAIREALGKVNTTDLPGCFTTPYSPSEQELHRRLSWLLKENDHLYEHNLDLFKRLSEAESLVEEMTAALPPLKERGR